MAQSRKQVALPPEAHYELPVPEKFSRSKFFFPQKIHYRGRGPERLAGPLVLVEGVTNEGATVRFRIDLAKRMMIDHPEQKQVDRACRRMTMMLTAHTVGHTTTD